MGNKLPAISAGTREVELSSATLAGLAGLLFPDPGFPTTMLILLLRLVKWQPRQGFSATKFFLPNSRKTSKSFFPILVVPNYIRCPDGKYRNREFASECTGC
jgi:hypothetical protein